MIRKRIEIVSCILALIAVFAVAARAAAQSPDVSRPRLSDSGAEAFRVRIEPTAPPTPLPPLPHVGTIAVEAAVPDIPADTGEFAPDIPYSYFWDRQDGLRWRASSYARARQVSKHSPGLMGAMEQPQAGPSLRYGLLAPSGGWSFGERNWQTRLDEGPEILLGSSELSVPGWNESVRLGGVSLSQSFLSSSDEVAQWNYSLAFGAVDQSASGTSGDLIFGPTAGSLALSYDYNPRLSLQSQTEVAAGLLMSGIVGQYDLGEFGRWRSGIARSNQGLNQGWRYRAMADFDLAEDVSLGWVGERYTDGFMDIRRYAASANPVAGGRQRWSASWDVGRWGQWSGSFESVHGKHGVQQRRFGLSQQFWYSPNLQIGIHAEREVVADDYDIGLRFSFPLY